MEQHFVAASNGNTALLDTPPAIDKKDVLLRLIDNELTLCSIHVLSTKRLATDLHTTQYRIRKCLNELCAEGLVVPSHEGGYNDYSDTIYCVHGFALTKKATGLPEYKEAYFKSMAELQKLVDGEL